MPGKLGSWEAGKLGGTHHSTRPSRVEESHMGGVFPP